MGLLRLLLAISVVFAHTNGFFGYYLANGALAVESFYIISGFYMTLVLREKYNQKHGYKPFILSRILRIYPTYWLILIISTILFIALAVAGNKVSPFIQLFTPGSTSTSLADIIYNIQKNIFIFTMKEYFLITPSISGFLIPQAWTLGLEVLFYIVAPFIVKRNIFAISAVTGTSLIIRFIAHRLNALDSTPFTIFFFPSVLCYFLFGAFSYFIYKWVEKKHFSKKILIFPLFLILLFLGIYSFFPYNQTFLFIYLKYYFYAFLVLCLGSTFALTKRVKWDNFLGNLSYPMYISHQLIIVVFFILFKNSIEKNIYPLAIIFSTLIVSCGIYLYFEKPIDNFRHKKFAKKKTVTYVTA